MRAIAIGWMVIAMLIGLVGLGIDLQVIARTMAPPQSRSFLSFLVYYLSFLTNLSNIGLLLVYLSDITDWRGLGWFRHPVTRAGMGGLITLVMGFYFFMLAPMPEIAALTGPIVLSNILLHYVTPVLYLLWWALFVPHGTLRVRNVPMMLVPGLTYVAYVLMRGAIVGEYPYTILDPGFSPVKDGPPGGYLAVIISVAVLVVMVAVFDLILVGLDRLLSRRTNP